MGSQLRDLLDADRPDMAASAAFLDGLGHDDRLAEVRSLGRRHLAKLFEAAAGHLPLTTEHFVPATCKALVEVVHHGQNSLPLFGEFAKVMCRPDSDETNGTELWGYNRGYGIVMTTVGPGYFVLRPAESQGEMLVDYLRTPPRKPDPWPPIIDNGSRLSFFVYNKSQDLVRGVSRHVCIGRQLRNDRPQPFWFALCREDPAGP